MDLLINLSPRETQTIAKRYLSTLHNYRERCHKYDIVFHVGRLTVLVSSLLVPALLSIQYNSLGTTANYTDYVNSIFWITWVLSLTVGILNGALLLFRVEKKYYLLHIIKSQLETEGFYYAGLTGRYNGALTPDLVPTHQNQFIFFLHAIERILMRETDVEYFRQYDNNMNINLNNQIPPRLGVGASARPALAVAVAVEPAGINLYHPSPDQPIVPIEERPGPVTDEE
jgi:hypothetical protein